MPLAWGSEEEFQGKLDFPFRVPSAEGFPEVGVSDRGIRAATKHHIVPGIEELTAELHAPALSNPDVLFNSQVPIVDAGAG